MPSRLERNGERLQIIAAHLAQAHTVEEVLEILPGVTRGFVEYWSEEVSHPRVKGASIYYFVVTFLVLK